MALDEIFFPIIIEYKDDPLQNGGNFRQIFFHKNVLFYKMC